MKYALRLFALLLTVSLWIGSIPAAIAQDPQFDAKFTVARNLEKTGTGPRVLESYAAVRKQYGDKEPEVAGEALLRAGLYASSAAYGRVEIAGMCAELHADAGCGVNTKATPDNIHEKQISLTDEGDLKAHEAYKELHDTYPTTKAAKFAAGLMTKDGRVAAGPNLMENLEAQIDSRRVSSPSYRVVDMLVALTGRVPGFSYWFALALIAFIVKMVTLPVTLKMYKNQREMQKLQPILKEIQAKFKGQELNEKLMQCYKEHGVNPAASCLPMLIQLPFMIWVYNMIRQYEYHFVHGTFFWIGSSLSHKYPAFVATNLGQFDLALLIIYVVSNYLTMQLTPPSDPQMASQQKSMSLMMTGMMFWMFLRYRWSSAFTFYWLVLNFISAWQQYNYIYKKRSGVDTLPALPAASLKSSQPAIPAVEPSTAMRARPRRKKR